MARALIAYETLTGTTREIAEEIGRTMADEGVGVTLAAVGDPVFPVEYHLVVLGAPIREARWVPGAATFLREHRAALSGRFLAVFAVGARFRPDSDDPEAESAVRAAVDSVLRSEGFVLVDEVRAFAGRVDASLLTGSAHLMFRLSRIPEGDWRDWDAVRGWARHLAGIALYRAEAERRLQPEAEM